MTIALRKKKFFKTRLSLANAFVEKLKTKKFDAISIKDICSATEVSEATFFNYFPQKLDIILYLLKIKLFKTFWNIYNFPQDLSATGRIEKTFELFANEITHPYIFFEIIFILGTQNLRMNSVAISKDEFKYIYPECQKAGEIRLKTLRRYFAETIQKGIQKNEFSKNISKPKLVRFLMTILKGVPLSTPLSEFNRIAALYQEHLSILWKVFQI
ncbi:MAG: hypothetical protein WC371_02140 [Parachlamydiales bacterium]|jgi:AcrR family transcriptional regulator